MRKPVSEFKLLSAKEEALLSADDRKKYFAELREWLRHRKLTNTTPGATVITPYLKKITNKICDITAKALACKDLEIDCRGTENIPDEPVIFAQSHQGILDNFIWIPQLKRHCLILHNKDVNPLLILCQVNTGLILITKDDREYAANAKLDIMEVLLKGFSVSWFPEGTYNLSPNKLHLPMKHGVADAARKTGAPIIPVVHDYRYEKRNGKYVITGVKSRYGKPIRVREEDDLLLKLYEFQESISTLKYAIMEEDGIQSKSSVSNWDYIHYIKEIEKNIKISKTDAIKEQANIYTANDEFFVFHHLNGIPFTDDGSFLDTDETRRLREINRKHGI